MEVINLFLLALASILVILGVIIIVKSRGNVSNIIFGFLNLVAATWSFTIALFRQADTLSSALLWDRAIYLSG
jgi:hypothetical protein